MSASTAVYLEAEILGSEKLKLFLSGEINLTLRKLSDRFRRDKTQTLVFIKHLFLHEESIQVRYDELRPITEKSVHLVENNPSHPY